MVVCHSFTTWRGIAAVAKPKIIVTLLFVKNVGFRKNARAKFLVSLELQCCLHWPIKITFSAKFQRSQRKS